MRVFLKVFLFVLGGLSLSSFSNAEMTIEQNPCMYNPAYCGGGQAAKRIVNIPNHYGAVAYDGSKGILGASENNLKSSRAAKKEAIQVCIKLGGTSENCRILVVSRNSCNAVALGSNGRGGGVSAGDADELQSVAERKVMQQCREIGGQKCFLAYSQCSRDPRYQVGR